MGCIIGSIYTHISMVVSVRSLSTKKAQKKTIVTSEMVLAIHIAIPRNLNGQVRRMTRAALLLSLVPLNNQGYSPGHSGLTIYVHVRNCLLLFGLFHHSLTMLVGACFSSFQWWYRWRRTCSSSLNLRRWCPIQVMIVPAPPPCCWVLIPVPLALIVRATGSLFWHVAPILCCAKYKQTVLTYNLEPGVCCLYLFSKFEQHVYCCIVLEVPI